MAGLATGAVIQQANFVPTFGSILLIRQVAVDALHSDGPGALGEAFRLVRAHDYERGTQ